MTNKFAPKYYGRACNNVLLVIETYCLNHRDDTLISE